MSALYILIPVFPLLAALVISLAGHRLGETSRKLGTCAIGLSFGLSVMAFADLVIWRQPISISLYELLHSGTLTINLGLYVDQLSVLLLLLVTGVSFVVHAYASRYMIGDFRYSRFFALMALFTFAMVTLVMSSNLLMVFMCWELMGICSYLLISHQSDRQAACSAATKAFLVNAVADVGLLFGIILIFATFGTLEIREILELVPAASGQTIDLLGWAGFDFQVQTVTLITLFLFAGCLGKSAQLPFHVWLPQAMEAPTPVSALIHAATMVNAGPFLLIRFSPLLMMSPVAMSVIAIIGGTTALFAGVVSLTQSDIKKILAYSTISQIGFMIMACGVGAFVAAVFHLLAHGILKGYLFLSTGSQLDSEASHNHVDHPVGFPKPSWSLYAGAFGLACITPLVLFSGPYEQLWTTHHSRAAGITFCVIGLLTVFLTAMYCVRGVISLFHASSEQTVRPRFYSAFHLQTLAGGAAVAIGLLVLLWLWFPLFLMPALAQSYTGATETWRPFGQVPILAIAMLVAVIGWAIACILPTHFNVFSVLPAGLRARLYLLFLNKFYFDEIYTLLIVRPTIQFSRWLWRVVDVGVIDRIVVQGGHFCFGIAVWLWRTVDVRRIQWASDRGGVQGNTVTRWLWTIIDAVQHETASQRIDAANIEEPVANHDGGLKYVSARPLQQMLLIQIFWLVLAMTFFYWLVLHP